MIYSFIWVKSQRVRAWEFSRGEYRLNRRSQKTEMQIFGAKQRSIVCHFVIAILLLCRPRLSHLGPLEWLRNSLNSSTFVLIIFFHIGIWSSVSGLDFNELGRRQSGNRRHRRAVADLNIGFREKKHECGNARAFDGPGGELAHG